MILTDLISNLRIELQDQAQVLYQDDELTRAVEKSVNLMSRLIPKRSILETVTTISIPLETLTMSGGVGTLAHVPVASKQVTISGKVEDTHFSVNYLTGLVTSLDSGLPDGTYVVSYTLDSGIVDISSLLPDYIKIERVEYPAGNSPVTLVTFDIVGSFLYLRGTTQLSDASHLRITYLEKWTPPTIDAEGNYPTHLDDAVIIGSAGQSLIYKAEKYTQSSVSTIDTIFTLLDTIDLLSVSAPALVVPVAPTLATLTPPAGYTVSKPSSPSLPTAPTAPTPPTLDFTTASTALSTVSTEIIAAKSYLTSGAAVVNTATRGDQVAPTYARFAEAIFAAANTRVNEAIARMRELEETLTLYASQITSYGSDVNSYANVLSATVGKYNADINNEQLGVQNAQSAAQIFTSTVQAQAALVSVYTAEVNAYQAEMSAYQTEVQAYSQQISAIISRATQLATHVTTYLDIAGRYLASGQAKINEMLTMLGVKVEFASQKSSSEQRA